MVLWTGSQVAQAAPAGRATAGPIERGIGLYGGRSVAFRVIDGWAVVEGDVKIGRAHARAQARRESRRHHKPNG
jgi:hypothetical protein